MELHISSCPDISSIKLAIVYFHKMARFKHFAIPFGVRKVRREYILKEYPDSIHDLEIKNIYPRMGPKFPKNLRYLTLFRKNGILIINDLELTRSIYKVSGKFVELGVQFECPQIVSWSG